MRAMVTEAIDMFKCLPIILLFAAAAWAQVAEKSSPSFEVASVRRLAQSNGREKIEAHPGSLIMQNVRLRACFVWAYGVKDYQIAGPSLLGAPGWLGREIDRYDISAKAAEGTPVSELRLMLRTLLAERFQAVTHLETRKTASYVLELGNKTGSGFRTAEGDGSYTLSVDKETFYWKNTTIAELADFLAGPLHRPVVDKTGLGGKLDITFDVAPYQDQFPSLADQEAALLRALQKQAGLILKDVDVHLEMPIVDRIERVPVSN